MFFQLPNFVTTSIFCYSQSFFSLKSVCFFRSAFVLRAAEYRAGSSLDCTLTFQLFQCQHGNLTRGPCSFIIVFSPHTSVFFYRDQETNRRLKNVSGKSFSFFFNLMIWLFCLSCFCDVTINSPDKGQKSCKLMHKNNLLFCTCIMYRDLMNSANVIFNVGHSRV